MRFLKCFAYILAEIAIVAATSYITICMTNTALYKEIAHNLSTNIGDFLGGTIGIVLTFISTIFLFLTFKFQQSQYKETKDDAFRARFEGTFFNMLSMYYNVRGEADKQILQSSKIGSKNLKEFYQGYQTFYKKEMLESRDFADAMKLLEKDDILETQYKTAVYDLGNLYDKYIQKQGCCAGFYFRYVHNLIAFVLTHWKDQYNDIHTYLNFIQAQMTDDELALVFYDCISNKGQDKKREYTFKENLDKYHFLENISEYTLLNRCHYKIFRKTVFRFLNDDERRGLHNT